MSETLLLETVPEEERISGPWHGVFVGVYATELDGCFYGYAKLFAEAPADLWFSPVVMKFAAGAHDRERDALDAAERKGVAAAEELKRPEFRWVWTYHAERAAGPRQRD